MIGNKIANETKSTLKYTDFITSLKLLLFYVILKNSINDFFLLPEWFGFSETIYATTTGILNAVWWLQ